MKRPPVDGVEAESFGAELVGRIRAGLEAEDIVDLWKVVFPTDRHVYYDDETEVINFNGEKPWWYSD